jgi:hypothetical protein
MTVRKRLLRHDIEQHERTIVQTPSNFVARNRRVLPGWCCCPWFRQGVAASYSYGLMKRSKSVHELDDLNLN